MIGDVLTMVLEDVLASAALPVRSEQKRTLRLVCRLRRGVVSELSMSVLSASTAAGIEGLARRLQRGAPKVRSLALRMGGRDGDGSNAVETAASVVNRSSATMLELEIDLAFEFDAFDCGYVLASLGSTSCPLRRIELAGIGDGIGELLVISELLVLRSLRHIGTLDFAISRIAEPPSACTITIRRPCDLSRRGPLTDIARPVRRLDLGNMIDVRCVDGATWHGLDELAGLLGGSLADARDGYGPASLRRLKRLELRFDVGVSAAREVAEVARSSTARTLAISSDLSVGAIAVALIAESRTAPLRWLTRVEIEAPLCSGDAVKAIDQLLAVDIHLTATRPCATVCRRDNMPR